jgi:hypothetical protein
MINRIISISLIFIFSTLLLSCKANFLMDAYSSDIFLDENVVTPAQMKVEISSCTSDDRAKHEQKVLALFASSSVAKIIDCQREGMNSFLLVSINAEIASETSNSDLILFREPTGEIEYDGEMYQQVGIKPVISEKFLQRVDTFMSESMQSLSYKDVTIEVSLNNDERDVVLVTGYDLWVDGQPYDEFNQLLARRQKLNLSFSNVISDLILQGKFPKAFYVSRKK